MDEYSEKKVIGAAKTGNQWRRSKPFIRSIMKRMVVPGLPPVLRHKGYRCSRPRTTRLMRVLDIRARTARKFKVTTDAKHHELIAPNLLGQKFSVEMPNEVWSTDITYLQTDSGWHYLTVIVDLFNREIIGYSLSSRLTTESTIIVALDKACLHRQLRRA